MGVMITGKGVVDWRHASST